MVGCRAVALNSPARTIDLVRFGRASEPSERDRLIEADNLVVLGALPDDAIDVVYLDPPFGTGGERQGGRGAYDDGEADPDAVVAWLLPRLAESRRVLRATGSLFLHLDYRAVHYAKVALDGLFGRERFVNEIVWCYAVGGKGRRGFGRKHDSILWYGKHKDYAFYPDAVRVPRRAGSHMRVVLDEGGRPVQEKTDRKTGKVYRYPIDRGKVPEDWWSDIETLNHSDAERIGWPTQKPERLIERLLAATAPPGGLVADWFSGSGTTAAVAQRTGRRFIAVDRSAEAIGLASARLQAQGRRLAATGAAPHDLAIERSAVQPMPPSDARQLPPARGKTRGEAGA
jgi:DNA modification methylase